MMLQKKSLMIWITIFIAVTVLGLSYYYGAVRVNTDKKPSTYSVILYQDMDNEWMMLTEGIRQAAEDFRVNINYINMSPRDTAKEQAELIERERSSGTDGIILAAAESSQLGKMIESMHLAIPVIAVETGLDDTNEKDTCITADNYRMGQELGKKIVDDIRADHGYPMVTIVKEYMERESVKQRYLGLTDVLRAAEEDIKITEITRQEGDFDLSLFIGKAFLSSGNYIAALDKFGSEQAAAAWKSNGPMYREKGVSFKIYGIGNTLEMVNNLDNGYLEAFVYQNEFNMGYEGVRALVEKEEKGYFEDSFDIRHKLVTRENLYETENERMLFPNI